MFDSDWHEGLVSELEYIHFKNPISGKLSVRVYRGSSDGQVITLSNELGQVMGSCRGDEVDLDISGLEAGVYCITVSNCKTMLSKKFILENI